MKDKQQVPDSNVAQTFVVCSIGTKPRKNKSDGILKVDAATIDPQNPVKN